MTWPTRLSAEPKHRPGRNLHGRCKGHVSPISDQDGPGLIRESVQHPCPSSGPRPTAQRAGVARQPPKRLDVLCSPSHVSAPGIALVILRPHGQVYQRQARPHIGAMRLDLTDEEAAALIKELADITGNDRYPFSRRIRSLRAILAELRPEPVREPLPPPKVYAPPRATAGRRRHAGRWRSA
jgi:hypothetical protein